MLLSISICSFPWWLSWLLPFLLGLLLGWLLWGKFKSRIAELEGDISKLRSKITNLESDLESCHENRASLNSDLAMMRGRLSEAEATAAAANARAEASSSVTTTNSLVADVPTVEAEVIPEPEPISAPTPDPIPDPVSVPDPVPEAVSVPDPTPDPIIDQSTSTDPQGISSEIANTEAHIDAGDVELSVPVAEPTPVVEASISTQQQGIASGGGTSKRMTAAFGALKPDNLQIVEGIGPKMNEVLNNAGVTTWSELAAKTPGEIRAILDAVNAKRYRIIDPTSWPDQAALANDGDWEGLIKIQKNLDSGRAQGATGETDSKVEKLLIKMGVLKKWKQDDLTAVEGIGPKISGLLKDAGINTWRELSTTQVSKLQEVLDAAGKRYKLADPSTWPKQADMAADGRWDDLQEYQDFLQGGK